MNNNSVNENDTLINDLDKFENFTTSTLRSTTILTEILTVKSLELIRGECDKEGPCKSCHYSLNIPKNVPKLIGCGLTFLIAIVVFILYLVEERRKEKYFYYNNLNEENEEEKNDRDAIAFGTNNVSYVVEQSACGTPKNLGGGFKVLERKPKAQFAHAPPITPFSTNAPRQSRVRTVKKEEEDGHQTCQVQIVADRLGRATELVSILNETDVPVSFTSAEEKANYGLDMIRTHLEKMKLAMTSPVSMQITAFSVRMERPNEKPVSLFTPTAPQVVVPGPAQPARPNDVPPTIREALEKAQPANITTSSIKKVVVKLTPTKEEKKEQTIDTTVTNSTVRRKKPKEKAQVTTSSKKNRQLTKKAQNSHKNTPIAPQAVATSLSSNQPQQTSKNKTPRGSRPNSPTSLGNSNAAKTETGSTAAVVRKKLKEMASGKGKREDSPSASKEKEKTRTVEKGNNSALNSER